MPVRLLPFLALVASIGLIAEPFQPLRAEQTSSASPGLILRFRPIDSLQVDIKYLVKAMGQEEAAKQVDALLDLYVKNSGIDTKKPLGIYGTIGAQGLDSKVVGLVPINDEKAFLKFLDGFNYSVKNKGGVYTIEALVGQQDAYMRFANGYAYISNINDEVSDAKKLLVPSAVFDPTDKAAVSAILRIGQVPKAAKDKLIDGMTAALAQAKANKLPDETEGQTKLKQVFFDEFASQVKQVLNAGNEVAVRFDIDSRANEVSYELSLSGQPTSKLAKNIADLGSSKSLFLGALGSDSAMNLLFNGTIPEGLKKGWGPAVDEALAEQVKKQKEKNAEYGAALEKLLNTVAPTLKAGEFNSAVTMRGPSKDGKYVVVAGVKLVDGLKIDAAFRDYAKVFKEKEQKLIKFDAQKIGNATVHEIDVSDKVDETVKGLFGAGPLYVAVRSDALYFAFGENATGVLKEALAAKPIAGPIVQSEMSLKRFAALYGLADPDIAKIAETAFAQGKGNDKVRVTVEGGKALRVRFSMKSDVLRFYAEILKQKGLLPAAQ
jgi:hypothetical protein